jgi:hypothetical protein
MYFGQNDSNIYNFILVISEVLLLGIYIIFNILLINDV